MKRFALLIMCFLAFYLRAEADREYDLVIVGGTPGGLTAAIAAAREGKTSVVLERSTHIGGLPVNGLGATDLQTRNATTGLFKEFLDCNHAYYSETFGVDSEQAKVSGGGFYFEPSVAEETFRRMLDRHRDLITVLTRKQFDSEPDNISIRNDRVEWIKIVDRDTKAVETYRGKVFVDATYEGDLAAAAGVPFRVGRESRSEFDEKGAGKVYKYWAGGEQDCSTFAGDNAIQAYNYRLCLTNDPHNRVPIVKPDRYDRSDYVSLIDDIWTGRHTGWQMKGVTDLMFEKNRIRIAQGGETEIPGDRWGIHKITNTVKLPNGKVDANNQHLSFVSTDLPEENWPWPTSGWDWRDRFSQRLRDYILGLFWFAQHDPELPGHFREAATQWGLAKDEYTDNQHFPRQVYVREGRRMEGEYLFTAKDALPVAAGERPPLHRSSVTASHYALDSHAVRKRETGKINLDGFISYGTVPYTVPFGVIVPRTIDNMLIPVPVSASHIGFSTLRMEPCWMALGQAAGIAAAISIENGVKVKNTDVDALQKKLVEQKATLIYFNDVTVADPDFAMTQLLAIRGYLMSWEADLNGLVDQSTAVLWSRMSGVRINEGEIRREALTKIYNRL